MFVRDRLAGVTRRASVGAGGQANSGSSVPGLLLMILGTGHRRRVQMAMSRARGFRADESGARLTCGPEALASALRKLELTPQALPLPQNQRLVSTSHLMIANPFPGGWLRAALRYPHTRRWSSALPGCKSLAGYGVYGR